MAIKKKKRPTWTEMRKIKSYHVPIFGGWVVLTLDREEHDKYMEWLDIAENDRPTDDLFQCCGFCNEYISKDGNQTVIVHIGDWRLDTLVHELSHAVFKLLDHRGVETGSGSRETFCYLIDTLFAEFYPTTTKRWQAEEDKKDAGE